MLCPVGSCLPRAFCGDVSRLVSKQRDTSSPTPLCPALSGDVASGSGLSPTLLVFCEHVFAMGALGARGDPWR